MDNRNSVLTVGLNLGRIRGGLACETRWGCWGNPLLPRKCDGDKWLPRRVLVVVSWLLRRVLVVESWLFRRVLVLEENSLAEKGWLGESCWE